MYLALSKKVTTVVCSTERLRYHWATLEELFPDEIIELKNGISIKPVCWENSDGIYMYLI